MPSIISFMTLYFFESWRSVVAMSSSQCVNRGRACIVVNRDNYSEYYMCVHVVWQASHRSSLISRYY